MTTQPCTCRLRGLGYLIDIVAGDISALPDAYAAGYKQGLAQTETEV